MKNIGLYIHIPFCKSKCPYCDFYSMRFNEKTVDEYVKAVESSIDTWADKINKKADTLYIGGGTPSLIGAERLSRIILKAKEKFRCEGEITVECNPSAVDEKFFYEIYEAGANRISLGMQSAVDNERKKLGRLADSQKVEQVIKWAKAAGFENISLDVMLGIPEQTDSSLEKTLGFCINSGVKHISAYMLKIEEGTWFYNNENKLDLPDEDTVADLYLKMVTMLEKNGFSQYEISNFSQNGYESKHNLKYWNCEEYLGIGPAAHSFIDGQRFYYPRDIEYFMQGNEPLPDGEGGDINEYIMLRLRLKDGLDFDLAEQKYHGFNKKIYINRAKPFLKNNLVEINENCIRLTTEGFLISNYIIEKII